MLDVDDQQQFRVKEASMYAQHSLGETACTGSSHAKSELPPNQQRCQVPEEQTGENSFEETCLVQTNNENALIDHFDHLEPPECSHSLMLAQSFKPNSQTCADQNYVELEECLGQISHSGNENDRIPRQVLVSDTQIESQVEEGPSVLTGNENQPVEMDRAMSLAFTANSKSPVNDNPTSNESSADTTLPSVDMKSEEQASSSPFETCKFPSDIQFIQPGPTTSGHNPALWKSVVIAQEMNVPSVVNQTSPNRSVVNTEPEDGRHQAIFADKSAIDDQPDGLVVAKSPSFALSCDTVLEQADSSSQNLSDRAYNATKEPDVVLLPTHRMVTERSDSYSYSKCDEEASAFLSYSEDFPSAISSADKTQSKSQHSSESSVSKSSTLLSTGVKSTPAEKYSGPNTKTEESHETDEDISEELSAEESQANNVSEVRLDLHASLLDSSQTMNMVDIDLEMTANGCDLRNQGHLKSKLPLHSPRHAGENYVEVPGTSLDDEQPPPECYADEYPAVNASRQSRSCEIMQQFTHNNDQVSLSESVSGIAIDDLDQLISIAAAAVESFASHHSGINERIVDNTANNLLTDAIDEILLIRNHKRANGVSKSEDAVIPSQQLDLAKSGASDCSDAQVCGNLSYWPLTYLICEEQVNLILQCNQLFVVILCTKRYIVWSATA
jgi:hypothetical protein